MSTFHNRTALILALTSALALSACGKSAPPPPPAPAPAPAPATPPPPPPPPPVAAAPAVQVTGVTLGNALADGKITAPANTFAPKDTIYAIVNTTSTVANSSITGHFSFGGQTVFDDAQVLKDVGPNATTFHIAKPDGFPAGAYTLDVLLDGKPISSTGFTVK
jgi:hypothetical protein